MLLVGFANDGGSGRVYVSEKRKKTEGMPCHVRGKRMKGRKENPVTGLSAKSTSKTGTTILIVAGRIRER